MYGTVGRLRIKSGHLSNLIDAIREVEGTSGLQTMSISAGDNSETDYYLTIVWADKASHDANGERPGFAAEYERLLATLAGELEWHSGEIVYTYEVGTR